MRALTVLLAFTGGLAAFIASAASVTASGEGAAVQFTNETKAAGIEFRHYKGEKDISTILEEAGPGVCVADFDGDGYQDIYFVNGRDRYGRGVQTRNALYRNNRNG